MTRHGLTLIEVLAAIVLLSIMTAVVVPAMTQSTKALHAPPNSSDEIFKLAAGGAADAFLADPTEFGFKDFNIALRQGEFSFDWPSPPDSRSESETVMHVDVRVLRSTDSDIDHAWMLFCSGDQCVARWVMLPKDEKGGATP